LTKDRWEKLFKGPFMMEIIGSIHQDISTILEGKIRRYAKYIDEFLSVVSRSIEKLEIFPYHIIWEYAGEKLPEYLSGEEQYLLREVSPVENKDMPINQSKLFDFPEIHCIRLPLTKQEFTERVINYFDNGRFEKIFDLPIDNGYSYFNMPIFPGSTAGKNQLDPYWIFTFILKEEDKDLIDSDEFFKFFEFFTNQVGLALDKFMENLSNKIQSKIDHEIGSKEKEQIPTHEESIKAISRLLADEFKTDGCAIFLEHEQEETLKLEASSIDLPESLNYRIHNSKGFFVSSYKENKPFRYFRREKLLEIFDAEYCQCIPINDGKTKLGIIFFLRSISSKSRNRQDKVQKRIIPYSEIETGFMNRIQRIIYEVVFSYNAYRHRLMEIRNLIEQVTAPVKSIVGHLEDMLKGRVPKERYREKFAYLNKLSKISLKYATNFEKTLEIDVQNIQPKKVKLYDLRDYLIGLSMEFQPLIRKKCISIRITDETPNDIDIYVDKDLFSRAIANIMDNAVKYSFFPEERDLLGYQAKPFAHNAEENVLITATKNGRFVIITIASLGLEILEHEKNKIFNRGFRGIKAKDRFNVGPGIGLYIAKKIIEAHTGRLELVTHPSKYKTIFRITIPRGEAEQ